MEMELNEELLKRLIQLENAYDQLANEYMRNGLDLILKHKDKYKLAYYLKRNADNLHHCRIQSKFFYDLYTNLNVILSNVNAKYDIW